MIWLVIRYGDDGSLEVMKSNEIDFEDNVEDIEIDTHGIPQLKVGLHCLAPWRNSRPEHEAIILAICSK